MAAYTRDVARFKQELKKDATSFKPAGELVHTYTLNNTDDHSDSDEVYEIYSVSRVSQWMPPFFCSLPPKGRWDTPEIAELCMRIRLLPLLYIEGAQFLEEDPRWEIVTL